jgi:hypothetical protein
MIMVHPPDYKVGDLLHITSGEYSDKCTQTIARVVVSFDKAAMIAAFKLSNDTEEYDVQSRFVKWLIHQGVVEEMEYSVMHLGGYSELE